uniref:Putative kunitz n=1 Tax=Rhipicephalus microplus TaxID=6941 RepID=A0A6G5A5F2_RHIMP
MYCCYLVLWSVIVTSDKRPDKCLLQYDSGVCEASKPLTVWFYSTTYGACMPFTYNGCNRNENRFSSCEECRNKCKSDVCTEKHHRKGWHN